MFPRNRADWLSLGVVVGVAVLGVALAPRLPAEVAVHFGPSGTPDNYVPRRWALVLVPATMLATVLVVRGAALLDPPNDPRSVDAVVVGTTGLLGAVHLLVLGWNLGYRIPMSLVVVGAVLWSLALTGYVVVRETTG